MRLAGLLLALLLAGPGTARSAGPLTPVPGQDTASPGATTGAAVWLHPYAPGGPAPPPPAWMDRLSAAGWALWQFDRTGGRDPLEEGAQRLAKGTAALRARGYRRVVLVGESRGAFVALVALRQSGLADAVVLAAPAAHGTSAERRAQALADFTRALEAASPSAAPRMALLLFRDDAWDPDPAARAALFMGAMARQGVAALVLDRPEAPVGHGGLQAEAFDALFGDCLARFLDFADAPPRACP
ncbi:alpha/beta hydrolase family protein [Falsiroseomonas sp. HC035]|uniref:alpha/beta hydrolase family protein n=1 Tax=Falsiroseomonas sp. HC035 TaxID=3390999 RepID=UPI003D3105B1